MVVVEDGDLVAEEAGGLCPPVGDQRLCLRELQLEFIPQELAELALDLLGFASWPGEPEQEVIGLCRGSDYAESRIEGSRMTWSEELGVGMCSA